jgi:KDO2-lipid IV(A) lauroyltransferase
MRWRAYGALGDSLAEWWYRLDKPSVALARANIQAVLGERLSADEVEKAIFDHFHVVALGKVVNDMLPDLSLAELKEFLQVEGEEHLTAALAEGRGVLMLGAHYGLHGYIPLTMLKRMGLNFAAVLGHEFPSDTWVYRNLVYPIRSRNWRQVPVINADGNPQREMVARLQRKEILVIWPDLVNEELFLQPAPHVLRVPFLGQTMPFRTGSFRLAQWMKIPTLPFFIVPREGRNRFSMVIEPPLAFSSDNSLEALKDNLGVYLARLQSYIMHHPGLWWQWRQNRLQELVRPAAG